MTAYVISLQSWSEARPKLYVVRAARRGLGRNRAANFQLLTSADVAQAQRFEDHAAARALRDELERFDDDLFAKVEEI